jgi:hypothetical protein
MTQPNVSRGACSRPCVNRAAVAAMPGARCAARPTTVGHGRRGARREAATSGCGRQPTINPRRLAGPGSAQRGLGCWHHSLLVPRDAPKHAAARTSRALPSLDSWARCQPPAGPEAPACRLRRAGCRPPASSAPSASSLQIRPPPTPTPALAVGAAATPLALNAAIESAQAAMPARPGILASHGGPRLVRGRPWAATWHCAAAPPEQYRNVS